MRGEDSQVVYRERGEGRTHRKRKRDKTIETDGNGKRDKIIETEGNGKRDKTIETEGNGKRDTTIETEGNGKREEVGQNSSPTGFRL